MGCGQECVSAFRRAVEQWIPDLCLIDIHLSGSDDPDWIKNLAPDLAVIFVTGDPDYAVHAFDTDAIDYDGVVGGVIRNCRIYRFAGGVTDAGLRKAWSAMKELFGGGAAKTHLA